jgi:hypothetical protein
MRAPSVKDEEINELLAQIDAWRKHCDTLTHQVICCGVAASHPDATLTTRGAYAGKWNSAQAEEVRKLRSERDALASRGAPPAAVPSEPYRPDPRNLVPWDGQPHAATDTVWIEPGQIAQRVKGRG